MKTLYLWITLIVSFILVSTIFWGIDNNHFLFLHDELLVLSKFDPSGSFFTNNLQDFGTANTTILIVTFFDRLYYFVTLILHLDTLFSQKILYFLKIFLSIWVPFLGFRKLFTLFTNYKANDLTIFIISLWYAFNTYTIIYWHGNAFSLTLLMCYVLSPLAFYYFHKTVLETQVLWIDRLIFITMIFLMSFALYLFPVFILLVCIYSIFYLFQKKSRLIVVAKNLVITVLLYIPFVSIHLIIPYDIITSGTQALNTTGGETFGNLRGGLLYPLLMWFSWGIYTVWEPKNIFTFHSYFKTIPSILAPILLYYLIIINFIRDKKMLYKGALLISMLVMLFLIKGAQPPFGEIYLNLLENLPIFRVFRSPDNKFGFGIVFIIACLLLIASKSYKKKVFITVISLVILIQGYLLFSGIATKGQNTSTSSDRVILLGKDYKEYINFINTSKGLLGYISVIPPVTFANFDLSNGESHWGQDLLPKLTKYPYVYIDSYGGMNKNVYANLSEVIENGDIKGMNDFPIRFFVIRKDVKNYSMDKYKNIINTINSNYSKVFGNEMFSVFENTNYKAILTANNLDYKVISPVEYQIQLNNIKDSVDINLSQNFNKNWNLYSVSNNPLINSQDVFTVSQKPIVQNIKLLDKPYFNSWEITKDEIEKNWNKDSYSVNSDGTINVNLKLYFKTQAVFYLLSLITFSYLLVVVMLICLLSIRSRLKVK